MTALNFIIHPQEAFVATDTSASYPDTKEPFKYVSKIFVLPHLTGIICGTGVYQLALNWFNFINDKLSVKDMADLDQYVTTSLQGLAEDLEISDEMTATIYHFGYCEEQGHFRAFVYRSEQSFMSEEYPCAENVITGVKPQIDLSSIPTENISEYFIKLIQRQREEDLVKPIEN